MELADDLKAAYELRFEGGALCAPDGAEVSFSVPVDPRRVTDAAYLGDVLDTIADGLHRYTTPEHARKVLDALVPLEAGVFSARDQDTLIVHLPGGIWVVRTFVDAATLREWHARAEEHKEYDLYIDTSDEEYSPDSDTDDDTDDSDDSDDDSDAGLPGDGLDADSDASENSRGLPGAYEDDSGDDSEDSGDAF